jgi:hypothetical protein
MPPPLTPHATPSSSSSSSSDAAPEFFPLSHSLHPPLPQWQFACRRLLRPSFCHLVRLFDDGGALGGVIYSDDLADADARGLVPAPPSSVQVWLFHPSAHAIADVLRAVTDLPAAGDKPAVVVEAFGSASSKRFCDAIKFFRRVTSCFRNSKL